MEASGLTASKGSMCPTIGWQHHSHSLLGSAQRIFIYFISNGTRLKENTMFHCQKNCGRPSKPRDVARLPKVLTTCKTMPEFTAHKCPDGSKPLLVLNSTGLSLFIQSCTIELAPRSNNEVIFKGQAFCRWD